MGAWGELACGWEGVDGQVGEREGSRMAEGKEEGWKARSKRYAEKGRAGGWKTGRGVAAEARRVGGGKGWLGKRRGRAAMVVNGGRRGRCGEKAETRSVVAATRGGKSGEYNEV